MHASNVTADAVDRSNFREAMSRRHFASTAPIMAIDGKIQKVAVCNSPARRRHVDAGGIDGTGAIAPLLGLLGMPVREQPVGLYGRLIGQAAARHLVLEDDAAQGGVILSCSTSPDVRDALLAKARRLSRLDLLVPIYAAWCAEGIVLLTANQQAASQLADLKRLADLGEVALLEPGSHLGLGRNRGLGLAVPGRFSVGDLEEEAWRDERAAIARAQLAASGILEGVARAGLPITLVHPWLDASDKLYLTVVSPEPDLSRIKTVEALRQAIAKRHVPA